MNDSIAYNKTFQFANYHIMRNISIQIITIWLVIVENKIKIQKNQAHKAILTDWRLWIHAYYRLCRMCIIYTRLFIPLVHMSLNLHCCLALNSSNVRLIIHKSNGRKH